MDVRAFITRWASQNPSGRGSAGRLLVMVDKFEDPVDLIEWGDANGVDNDLLDALAAHLQGQDDVIIHGVDADSDDELGPLGALALMGFVAGIGILLAGSV